MHKYTLISKQGEGTFSEVLKAQCLKNQKYVAIKCMNAHFQNINQVQNLREIQALRKLSPHPHIIKLIEVLYDEPTGRLAMVFELMEKNLYELIQNKRSNLNEKNVKAIIYQVLKAVQHMHKNGIFHRDIKPENILISEDTVKLADFGSCRAISNSQPFTEYISTRWYRAPECLLTDGYYNYKMDIWGVGCVMFEILSKTPLFPGKNELGQIQIIHKILGTPDPELLERFQKQATHMEFNFPSQQGTGIAKFIPYASPECIDIIEKMLIYNPDERITAKQCLKHPFFKELRDLDKRNQVSAIPTITKDLGVFIAAPPNDRKNYHQNSKDPFQSTQQSYQIQQPQQAGGAQQQIQLSQQHHQSLSNHKVNNATKHNQNNAYQINQNSSKNEDNNPSNIPFISSNNNSNNLTQTFSNIPIVTQEPMFPDVNIKTTILMDFPQKYPYKNQNNFVSEESDNGENLPPIQNNLNHHPNNTMQPQPILQQIKMNTQTLKKINYASDVIPTNPIKVNPSKKKNQKYISPYSQKGPQK